MIVGENEIWCDIIWIFQSLGNYIIDNFSPSLRRIYLFVPGVCSASGVEGVTVASSSYS